MSEELALYNTKQQQSIEQMQMLLNAHPDKSDVAINNQARNAKYLPINIIERKLDEMYNGLWQTTNFRCEVIFNEIIGMIDLQVFHPAAKIWITRTGLASVMIQTQAGKPVSQETKIKNTLVKDFPKLRSECIKNAAKSLGVVFGRNLNRGEEDEYTYLTETVTSTVEGVEEATRLMQTAVLTETERKQIEARIGRATPKTIEAIINHLKNKQS